MEAKTLSKMIMGLVLAIEGADWGAALRTLELIRAERGEGRGTYEARREMRHALVSQVIEDNWSWAPEDHQLGRLRSIMARWVQGEVEHACEAAVEAAGWELASSRDPDRVREVARESLEESTPHLYVERDALFFGGEGVEEAWHTMDREWGDWSQPGGLVIGAWHAAVEQHGSWAPWEDSVEHAAAMWSHLLDNLHGVEPQEVSMLLDDLAGEDWADTAPDPLCEVAGVKAGASWEEVFRAGFLAVGVWLPDTDAPLFDEFCDCLALARDAWEISERCRVSEYRAEDGDAEQALFERDCQTHADLHEVDAREFMREVYQCLRERSRGASWRGDVIAQEFDFETVCYHHASEVQALMRAG